MKRLTGRKVYRKEGQIERLNQEIECTECGAKTYVRRAKRVEAALKVECRSCKSIAAEQRYDALRLLRQQDKALIDSHKSILQLHQRLKKDNRVTHGLSTGDTRRTYYIWVNMMARCYKESTHHFNDYGGRGISVCDRWHDVTNFIEDMGIAPDGYSIERHDVNGNYEPSNCSWIPMSEQAKNKRCSLSNRGITDAKAHWREHRRLWARKRKNQPLDLPKGNCATYKSPANAWWRAANRSDLRYKLYGPSIPTGKASTAQTKHRDFNWWIDLGCKTNPYIYGPMPWKRTSKKFRRAEAIATGVFTPPKFRKKKIIF